MEKQSTVDLFRARLLEVIEQAGLTRSAFAKRVGIDRSTLSQILSAGSDRLPRVETLTAIARSEQVSIDWLVGLTQEGGLRADLVHQDVEFQEGGRSPADERVAQWLAEAVGYKIRSVPTTLPDFLKTDEVIEYEYRTSAAATPQQRQLTSRDSLDYSRRLESDTEICTPLQRVETLAQGSGIYQHLPLSARRAQLLHMATLVEELYPRFRWFLYDGLSRFSAPLTIFGPIRAAIYVGQMYLVLTGRDHVTSLVNHFDELIRAAVVQPPDVPQLLLRLHDAIAG